jgi:hypothetical protein
MPAHHFFPTNRHCKTLSQYLCNLGLAIQIVYTILSEHVQPRRAHCALITIFAPGLEMTILTE